MDGERISLRLEPEDLELIDNFVAKHPEYSNRSHLARIALRSFIEKDAVIAKPSKDRVTENVPSAIRAIIERMVDEGYYSSTQAAIEEALRDFFLPKAKMQELKEKLFTDDRKVIERM